MIKENIKYPLFGAGYDNSHSYRIPSMLKLSSGRLIAVADQRIENAMDVPWTNINQFLRYSDDNGKTWSKGNAFLKVEKLNNSFVGAIDSQIVEDKITKEVFLIVDIFPAGSGIIRTVEEMNPIVKEGYGYTPDKKYQRFHQLGSDKKFVMKQIKQTNPNENWYEVFELKDNNWSNTDDSNLLKTKIVVDNSYYPETKLLRGSVYENIDDYKNITAKPICSIYDGFDANTKDFINPKYYIDSTAYIFMFKSKDQGDNWELVGNMNPYFANKEKGISIIVGPGKGLQLQRQKDEKLNGRLLLPLYTAVKYEVPEYFYSAYSDDHGKTWSITQNANPKSLKNWQWMSETQIIEDNNGVVWAFMRQEEADKYCLAISKDGGMSWQDLENKNEQTCFMKDSLNTTIMFGLAYFRHENVDYALVSLPTTVDRKDGKLFIMDLSKPQELKEIYSFNEIGDTFGYSTIEILSQDSSVLEIGIIYEVSTIKSKTLAWIGFDEEESSRSLATEMYFENLKIDLKKLLGDK